MSHRPGAAQSNGNSRRPLVPGVYVPTVAFFDAETEDVDLATVAKHAVRLAQAGVAGITTQGSNGEAVHLSHSERDQITQATRNALDDAGFEAMPIIVGAGSQSTRESIELCREGHAAGGDYALVLPPSYYKPLFAADSVSEFFRDVASASPIPILIYNYPGAVSGLDLSSDDIIELAQHPNIVGCKLTCGNTGKLNRIAAATHAATVHDRGSGFMCLGGSADFILQTLVAAGSGTIGGLGNVARGDWAVIQGGIVGTKSTLQSYCGYGGFARKPLPRPGKAETARWKGDFEEIMEVEGTL
ncbi:hypothetical protein B0A49_05256 [Cryomyces minteri]|uniref:4-hydroxy-2-oxoglutarate aldolase, mitochondrial n=1 Tax=Cryomyces minteri TaxID=331657 RepID=A0A4U0X9N0_9PEZI|nr:hypothetical protein B0A49_05256 [Cryomyces minteri]